MIFNRNAYMHVARQLLVLNSYIMNRIARKVLTQIIMTHKYH
jgi:hypothetical protein